jgi:uncharacterized membrane protein
VRRLANWFFQGLIVTAPIFLTLYICWIVFRRIDSWLGLRIPGAGFVATIALITVVGFLASNLLTRSVVGVLDAVMNRLPFVRLLYSATRDLLNAFVGEQRRFDRPVLVTLAPGSGLRALGFVTQESLDRFDLANDVAVYVPQSYNFAGNLLIVPREQISAIRAESADVLTFIVSGGVTESPTAQRMKKVESRRKP